MTINLNKELFDFQCIMSAAEAFKELAEFDISNTDKKYYSVQLKNCVYSEETTGKEFENYLSIKSDEPKEENSYLIYNGILTSTIY